MCTYCCGERQPETRQQGGNNSDLGIGTSTSLAGYPKHNDSVQADSTLITQFLNEYEYRECSQLKPEVHS